ncbi:MAG: AraC family transcriptional regulator [Brachymonas sp.]|nr:AraC family transcriptional regulator [Brachymonas sp.]
MPAPDLDAIAAHIRAHLHENPRPAEIAVHFGINRFRLSRWFRAQTGLSLRDYIAALKIEQGIGPLVEGQPIIDSQLEAGHASAATYAHRFRAHTGQSPRDYRAQAASWGSTLSQQLADDRQRVWMHHSFNPAQHPQAHALTVQISGGSHPRHVVFAGLFAEPIPRGVPVAGAALFGCRRFSIDAVPNGSYWLLGCEMAPSRNPLHYFRLDHCPRGMHGQAIRFPMAAPSTIDLQLRPLQASDPPITVNLPKLLFDYLRKG